MYWNDEGLANHQANAEHRAATGEMNPDLAKGDAELYRLARLGLAAETVGKTALNRCANFAFDNTQCMEPLINSPAWRRE